MTHPPAEHQVLLAATVLVAGVYDLRYRRIPNWLTLSALLFGVALNASRFGWSGLQSAAAGLGLAVVIYFPMYLVRGMGAGDVKLMAALGSIVGPAHWFTIFLISSILGALCAVALLAWKGRLRRTLQNVGFMLKELFYLRPPYLRREELDVRHPMAVKLPHGLMVAVGTAAFLAAIRVPGS
ncbi:MAG: A24 family peptidase [Bryobacterales bacterium]|nr:A24 family peptidase [Bryobacteraceae bacterium]MDW8354342.1 A24 family peptidase [Bryobacterales bacterium]